MRRETWLQLLSVLFVGGGLVSLVSGCEAPPVTEEHRLVQHKLLTPDPVMRVKASSETREAYGIDEWRFYRGRGALFATGYSAKGKALRGLSTKIARATDGTISHLELDVNNGGKVGILTQLASATTASNAGLDVPSQAFLRRAVLDFARVGVASDLRLRSALTPTRADVCGAAVPNVFTSLANCVRNANQNTSRVAACLRAAELVEQTRTNCRGLASPNGRVVDPLSGLGMGSIGSSQLLQLCGGDPRCARDMSLLETEELFGQQCNGNLGCLTEDFGFGPFGRSEGTGGVSGSTGSTGSGGVLGSGSVRTRPDLGGLGNPEFGAGAGSCLLISGRCGGDQFQCIGGDCDAFKGKGAGDFQCIGGDCEAFKGNGASGSGSFDCLSGDCDAFKGSGSSGTGGNERIGGFDCTSDGTCSDIGKGATSERIGGFDCTSDGTCSDIGKGADTTEQPFVDEPSTGEVFGSDPVPSDNGAGGGDTAFASVRFGSGR